MLNFFKNSTLRNNNLGTGVLLDTEFYSESKKGRIELLELN